MKICLKETILMNWKRYNVVDVSCSCDAYVLNSFFGMVLIYLKKMMMMSCFFFGDLEELCERPITSLSAEGCLTKTLL